MNTNRLEMLLGMYDEANHDSFILFAIAKEYEYLGNIGLAIAQFNKLKSLEPNYVGIYYHLANLYQTLEDFHMALSTYDEGINVAIFMPYRNS
jgi:tetratricopeptide (TPR) repeat protein